MLEKHDRGIERPALGRSDMRAQFAWYLAVGGASFAADLVIFTGLLAIDVPVMAALSIGFVIGTLTNYVLSRSLAFTGGRFRRLDEVLRLFAVAGIGLALTALLVEIQMALGLSAIAAKIVATPIVLVWNYVGRRIFVFHAEMPVATWRLSTSAVDRLRSRFSLPPRERND